jgi:UDP-glucose 4-epimerase
MLAHDASPDPLAGASVLVTGGAGFIGSHLVRALMETGAAVTVLDDLSAGGHPPPDGVRLVRGDVRDAGALGEATRDRPSHVFHLAARASVPESIRDPATVHDVNATGTLRLLEAAVAGGARRFVYSSSTAVYGDTERLPVDESLPTRPTSPYGASKLAAEAYALAYRPSFGLGTVALRYFNVFGPGQDPRSEYAAVIPRFIDAYLSGSAPTIYGDGEQTRDFVFVHDVVRANLLAAVASDAALGRAYNVANGVARSVNELAESVRSLVGAEVAAVHADPRPGEIVHSVADVGRARDALGFEAETPFPDGLRTTVEWFRTR